MSLTQLKTFIVGVLKGWFTNKSVLDKFSESPDGKLLYNGVEVGGSGSQVTSSEVTQAITDTLTELNQPNATE